MRERELKLFWVDPVAGTVKSLPVRERELKPDVAVNKPKLSTSLPVRERELKQVFKRAARAR